MFEREFLERRESERRKRFTEAAQHHFAECERRAAHRRLIDTSRITQWINKFDNARKLSYKRIIETRSPTCLKKT